MISVALDFGYQISVFTQKFGFKENHFFTIELVQSTVGSLGSKNESSMILNFWFHRNSASLFGIMSRFVGKKIDLNLLQSTATLLRHGLLSLQY